MCNSSKLLLGVNLSAVTDWSTQRPFINLFKQSRPWITQCDDYTNTGCWDTQESHKLDIDDNGWVRSISPNFTDRYNMIGTILDVPNTFPSGRYLLLYEGEGFIRYGGGITKLNDSTHGRDVLYININNGPIHIQITKTDPNSTGSYLQNIRLIRETDENTMETKIFSQDFLDRVQPFHVLRFMDWQETNGCDLTQWNERPKVSAATYSTSGKNKVGIPIETMIHLANETHKSAWFNMPHKADDEYIRQFASLVKESLHPEILVYVEYSNEVWNTLFPQHEWIRQQANLLWPNSGESDYTKVINWYGKRSIEICDIWKTVFGDQSSRVVSVLGAQAANDWTASAALDASLWEDRPDSPHKIDAIAIAPYFGGYIGNSDHKQTILEWTQEADGGINKLFDELNGGDLLSHSPSGGAIAETTAWIETYQQLAETKQLQLIAYEGGQHLVYSQAAGDNDDEIRQIAELFIKLNRDTRMGDLYKQYLDNWRSLTNSLMIHFNDIEAPSKWGCWGALEDALQTTSPKYDALLNYINNH